MTTDGTIDEKMQRSYLDLGLRRLGVKEGASIEKVFDFWPTRKAIAELEQTKWRPLP
jgi:hypothetical protein